MIFLPEEYWVFKNRSLPDLVLGGFLWIMIIEPLVLLLY